ncbi:MAG: murein transglycosylase A [Bacteroidota bacterium]
MRFVIWLFLLFGISSCLPSVEQREEVINKTDADKSIKTLEPGKGYEFAGNGKTNKHPHFDSLYRKTTLRDTFDFSLSEALIIGLNDQLTILKGSRKVYPDYGNLPISKTKLRETIRLLTTNPNDLSDFELFQICGEDSLGNMHFTGYFTPILNVKREADSTFRYPLYKKPVDWQGPLPTREEIDGNGVLKGKNLELAWTDDLLAIFFMQVQGSGMVQFPDGKRTLFSYGGGNDHKYRSLGKYLVFHEHISPEQISLESIRDWFFHNPDSLPQTLFYNPSYIFFRASNKQPSGSGAVPLLAGHSVAVDPKFIPYGSVLLGKIPVLDKNGKLERHEYRILLPQDTGGAIKGPGHIDLYMGIGKGGEALASAMHHYGEIYLILAP